MEVQQEIQIRKEDPLFKALRKTIPDIAKKYKPISFLSLALL